MIFLPMFVLLCTLLCFLIDVHAKLVAYRQELVTEHASDADENFKFTGDILDVCFFLVVLSRPSFHI
jgi:hypothetical protein